METAKGEALRGVSSSSRRTWIEIGNAYEYNAYLLVVLLAEDVDRNCNARSQPQGDQVVLLAEDVDRNVYADGNAGSLAGRPPRGGRG